MSELELFKFINEEGIEIDWRGEMLIAWINLWDLDDFVVMVGEEFFCEGGYDVNLQYRQVALDLVPICEYFGIEPTNILKKED